MLTNNALEIVDKAHSTPSTMLNNNSPARAPHEACHATSLKRYQYLVHDYFAMICDVHMLSILKLSCPMMTTHKTKRTFRYPC